MTMLEPKHIYSVETEQSLLGAVLIKNDVLRELGGNTVSGKDFYRSEHRTIWRAMMAMAKRRAPIDVVTLFEALGPDAAEDVGGLAYLNALIQAVPSARNAGEYAKRIREYSRRRAVLEQAEKLREAIAAGSDSSEAVAQAVAAFQELAKGGTKREPRLLGEVMIERTEYYERVQNGEIKAGQTTGIPELDELCPLADGSLTVIAARPGVGKSALALAIAIDAAKAGAPWLFMSQEMHINQVADRAMVRESCVPRSRIKHGRMTSDEWSRLADVLETAQGVPIWADDQPGLSLMDINLKMASIRPKVRGGVVDYVQLCSEQVGGRASRSENVGAVTRGLKTMAKELNCPIIALSQLSRDVEKRGGEPKLSDLRDSGEIEQDADNVWFIHPTGKKVSEDGEEIVKLIGAKGRDDGQWSLYLAFDKPTQRFRVIPEPYQEPEEKPRKRGFQA